MLKDAILFSSALDGISKSCRYAVAGLNAQAASNLANSLGKSPHPTVEDEDEDKEN